MQSDSGPAPLLSVIIPVFNGADTLALCLEAVFTSDFSSFEVIVIDDHSKDDSVAIARKFPCVVIESLNNSGPAGARNIAASKARGPIFFFLDADIVIRRDTLSGVNAVMAADPGLTALFGSYGRETVPRDFFSRYKNLVHHYTHQNSREEASTFCSGFGAIRDDAFRSLGGFDPHRRFLEDIEFGYRLWKKGLRVRLCKELQMTHCKRYTLASLVRSDLFGRAIPWTRLMLETGIVRNDLNTRWNNLISVPLAFLLLLCPLLPIPWMVGAALAALFLALNAWFLALTYAEGGIGFALQACVMCWFTYLYSGVGVLLGFASHYWSRLREESNAFGDLPQS